MQHVRHTLAALASACLLVACGGGGDEGSTTSSSNTATAEAPATVQLEGCVVGPQGQPQSTRLHAFGEDGRLVAHASSNAEGLFTMQVPARSAVTLSLDAPGHEQLPLITGSTRLALGGCLSERAA